MVRTLLCWAILTTGFHRTYADWCQHEPWTREGKLDTATCLAREPHLSSARAARWTVPLDWFIPADARKCCGTLFYYAKDRYDFPLFLF